MSTQHQDAGRADSNREVVSHFMRLMDSHRLDDLDEVLAPNLQFHLGSTTLDRMQTEEMIRAAYAAFPDFTHTVNDILAIDDRVVLRATDQATHLGEFQGVAPTERQITFGQIAIYQLADGRIVEAWEQADIAGLMQQLTSVPDSE